MKKLLLGLLMMMIIVGTIFNTRPQTVDAGIPGLIPVVKAGATVAKKELRVILGGAAVKSGVQVTEKKALQRAQENWFSRMTTDEITSLETALGTSVPSLNRPGFMRVAVPLALMLSGADMFVELSILVNGSQPLDRNTATPFEGDKIQSYGGYELKIYRSTSTTNYYGLFYNPTHGDSLKVADVTSMTINDPTRTDIWLDFRRDTQNASLINIGNYTQYFFSNGNVSTPSYGRNYQASESTMQYDKSAYVTYKESPNSFQYHRNDPVSYPDPVTGEQVVYIEIPDPATVDDPEQSILDNLAIVTSPVGPLVDPMPEPQPSPEPSIVPNPNPTPDPNTNPNPTTDPNTNPNPNPSIDPNPNPTADPNTNPNPSTGSNAGLFEWLKTTWANFINWMNGLWDGLMDFLNGFWASFLRNMEYLFVPTTLDTSPLKNIWADRFPAIESIKASLVGLTTLNYDQTAPKFDFYILGKQYTMIDMRGVPSIWINMARIFIRISIWSGLLFMILREWRPKPHIG